MRTLPLLLLLAGCAGPAPIPARRLDPVKTWGGAETRMEETAYYRVVDAGEWSGLWPRHAGEEKRPEIDFERDMVIAAFWGPRDSPGAPGLQVTKDERRIHVLFTSYVGDAYPQHPPVRSRFMFIVLPKLTLPLTVAGAFRSMLEPDAYQVLKEFPALAR